MSNSQSLDPLNLRCLEQGLQKRLLQEVPPEAVSSASLLIAASRESMSWIHLGQLYFLIEQHHSLNTDPQIFPAMVLL